MSRMMTLTRPRPVPRLPARRRGRRRARSAGRVHAPRTDRRALRAARDRRPTRRPTASRGAITDDTQMTLFTAEGPAAGLGAPGATQGICPRAQRRRARLPALAEDPGRDAGTPRSSATDGWLFAQPESARAPCAGAHLRLMPSTLMADVRRSRAERQQGLRRRDAGGAGWACSAPALVMPRPRPSRWDVRWRRSTHGHPTGQLTAGVLAVVIAEICAWRDAGGGARRRDRDAWSPAPRTPRRSTRWTPRERSPRARSRATPRCPAGRRLDRRGSAGDRGLLCARRGALPKTA